MSLTEEENKLDAFLEFCERMRNESSYYVPDRCSCVLIETAYRYLSKERDLLAEEITRWKDRKNWEMCEVVRNHYQLIEQSLGQLEKLIDYERDFAQAIDQG